MAEKPLSQVDPFASGAGYYISSYHTRLTLSRYCAYKSNILKIVVSKYHPSPNTLSKHRI